MQPSARRPSAKTAPKRVLPHDAKPERLSHIGVILKVKVFPFSKVYVRFPPSQRSSTVTGRSEEMCTSGSACAFSLSSQIRESVASLPKG